MSSRFKIPIVIAFAFFTASSAWALVYRPGLIQAKFNTANDRTSDIASNSTAQWAPGPIMANNAGTYVNPYTGLVGRWGRQTMFGYAGEMYFEGGVSNTFGKCFDDGVYLTVNGQSLIANTGWNTFVPATFIAPSSGWYPIDIRFGNEGGGAGPSSTTWNKEFGFAYNTNGWTSEAPKEAWTVMTDPGDMSLFRCTFGESFLTQESITKNGSDYTFHVTTDVPDGYVATLYACLDTVERGEDRTAWAVTQPAAITPGTDVSGSITATWTGEGEPMAVLCLVAVDTNGLSLVEWTVPAVVSFTPSISSFAVTDASQYACASFSAILPSLGLEASSVQAYITISRNENMSVPVYTGIFDLPQTVVPAAISDTVRGLPADAALYACLSVTNNLGFSAAATNIVSFSTVPATCPALDLEFLYANSNGATFAWAVTNIGVGNTSVTLYADDSSNLAFGLYSTSTNWTITQAASGLVTLPAPSMGEMRYARLRADGDLMDASTAVIQYRLTGIDLWVDSEGTGDGFFETSPSPDFRGIVNFATSNDVVHVRGDGREYDISGDNALAVSNDYVTVVNWGEEKALFRVTTYADPGNIQIAGDGITVSGLCVRVETALPDGKTILYAGRDSTTYSVFNLKIIDCDFTAVDAGINGKVNVIRAKNIQGSSPWSFSRAGTNMLVRGCNFSNFPKSKNLINLYGFYNRCIGNTIVNCARIFCSEGNDGWGYATIVSNRVYNPVVPAGSGVVNGRFGSFGSIVFAHNIIWNDGVSNTNEFYAFFKEGSAEGSFDGTTKIYNNTLYGVAGLMCSAARGTGNIKPLIANNIIINPRQSIIVEPRSEKTKTDFTKDTIFRNNVIAPMYAPGSTNAISLFESVYTNECPFAANMIDNSRVAEVSFYETRHTDDSDFLCPRGDVTREVMAGLGNVAGFEEYPPYVGAVEPRKGEAVSIIILR